MSKSDQMGGPQAVVTDMKKPFFLSRIFSAKKFKKYLTKKNIKWFAIGFGLLIFIVIVYSLTLGKDFKSNHVVTEPEAFKAMITQESSLRSKRQDAAAKKVLTDFLVTYPNNTDKAQLNQIYSELSAIYQSAGDYKTAQMWQTKALENVTNLSWGDFYNMAVTCQKNGDKVCAIANFKKANELLKTDKSYPGAIPMQNYINIQLKSLGG